MSDIELKLSKEEALVLFEFLGRINSQKDLNIFEDQAEQRVLWDIEAELETNLVEPFMSNYKEIVSKARETVRDEI